MQGCPRWQGGKAINPRRAAPAARLGAEAPQCQLPSDDKGIFGFETSAEMADQSKRTRRIFTRNEEGTMTVARAGKVFWGGNRPPSSCVITGDHAFGSCPGEKFLEFLR
jgi:hypothetical protein